MNNDYLWDKTGEPDPDIRELEQVLGTLRYQPRPLEIPPHLRIRAFRPAQRRFFVPGFAIAAALATILLGLGLWAALRNRQTSGNLESAINRPAVEKPSAEKLEPALKGSPALKEEHVVIQNDRRPILPDLKRRARARGTIAHNTSRGRRVIHHETELTAIQRAEAEKAKEQLLLALRVASAKLSLAQKRTQGVTPASLIRNQHKVG